jgi:hypothetical protein
MRAGNGAIARQLYAVQSFVGVVDTHRAMFNQPSFIAAILPAHAVVVVFPGRDRDESLYYCTFVVNRLGNSSLIPQDTNETQSIGVQLLTGSTANSFLFLSDSRFSRVHFI